jgi:Fe-S oxidoreductase
MKTLTAMGMDVHLPEQHCCGLPMLSKGMADRAENTIKKNLAQWGKTLDRVDHIVVTCSSCGLALKHDWPSFMDTPTTHGLAAKTIHVSRLILIMDNLDRLPFKKESQSKIAYHKPCHLKVQEDAACSIDLLSAVPGMVLDVLDSHCCGMAGSWGMMAKIMILAKK